MKSSAPLSHVSMQALKLLCFILCVLKQLIWAEEEQSNYWMEENESPIFLFFLQGLVVIVPVKGADVGQALPLRKYQGQC